MDHPVKQKPAARNPPIRENGNSVADDGNRTRYQHAAEPTTR
jgi:hypothetical protein